MFRLTHRSSSGAQNCNCSLWFYIRLWLPAVVMAEWELSFHSYVKPEGAITVLSSWWRAVCLSKHVEQLRNTGIINSTTRSHLVGYFYTIYIMMHGSINIKFFPNLRQNFNSLSHFRSFMHKTTSQMVKYLEKACIMRVWFMTWMGMFLLGHHVHNIYYHQHRADSFLELLQPRHEATEHLLLKMSWTRTNRCIWWGSD